jgi:hypothetical protein
MTDAASASLPALGICLEEYAYPYPVRFLPLANDLQPVAMAYMDIARSSPNCCRPSPADPIPGGKPC